MLLSVFDLNFKYLLTVITLKVECDLACFYLALISNLWFKRGLLMTTVLKVSFYPIPRG